MDGPHALQMEGAMDFLDRVATVKTKPACLQKGHSNLLTMGHNTTQRNFQILIKEYKGYQRIRKTGPTLVPLLSAGPFPQRRQVRRQGSFFQRPHDMAANTVCIQSTACISNRKHGFGVYSWADGATEEGQHPGCTSSSILQSSL